jgi:hypothetical protein
MGISFSLLDFFDVCHHCHALGSPMIGLGSLQINEPEADIEIYAARNQWWKRDAKNSVRSLFRDRYQIMDYRDLDIDGSADIYCDLNKPVDISLCGKATTVLNGGTLEHIFNIAQVLTNLHDMVAENGTMVHIMPVTWYEHGYFNFNPKLITAVAAANKYALVAEAFWFPTDMEGLVRRQNSSFAGLHHRITAKSCETLNRNFYNEQSTRSHNFCKGLRHETLFLTFDGQKDTPNREKVSQWFAEPLIPANGLYLVAYRKTSKTQFVFPYDVGDDTSYHVPRPVKFDPARAIILKGPFQEELGYAWQAPLDSYAAYADNLERPHCSKLILTENGQPLWLRHILHDEIRKYGQGRYSHWAGSLLFSTSDNTDPNTNKRQYQIVFAETP